jgi:uncharacterized iron-regulated protein
VADARAVALLVALVACGCRGPGPAPAPEGGGACVPLAGWVDPATHAPVRTAAVLAAAGRRRIVLLGERHDWAEDHRWQACVLSMLHGAHPRIVVGFEPLTPAADPGLGRWVAGERSVAEFLADIDWKHAWGLPPKLYLPVFQAGRLLGLELHGINVDRAVVRRVAADGFAALPAAERARLPAPRPPSPDYRARLAAAWTEHRCRPAVDGDPAFEHFIEAQRTWDAVMAGALARLADEAPDAVVVGIVGRGHVEHRDGIAADLAARGYDALVLLPWDVRDSCADLPADVADAVFGIRPLASEIPPPPPSPCERPSADQRPR